jgi:hypothetical protein
MGKAKDSMTYYLNEGKQGKHIEGHNNFIPGRSKITISLERLQELFNEYKGTGIKDENKEVVDFKEIIGLHVNEKTGAETPTTWGTIHYDKNGGYHIVPYYHQNLKKEY